MEQVRATLSVVVEPLEQPGALNANGMHPVAPVGRGQVEKQQVDESDDLAMVAVEPTRGIGPVAMEVEELTLTLGEGPGVDALTDGPVMVADLAAHDCQRRWPAFAPAAVGAGIRAMFALPLSRWSRSH